MSLSRLRPFGLGLLPIVSSVLGLCFAEVCASVSKTRFAFLAVVRASNFALCGGVPAYPVVAYDCVHVCVGLVRVLSSHVSAFVFVMSCLRVCSFCQLCLARGQCVAEWG